MKNITEQIKIVMLKRGVKSAAELARLLEMSPQNLNKKFKSNKFTNDELEAIAVVLDCEYEVSFVFKDTGERV